VLSDRRSLVGEALLSSLCATLLRFDLVASDVADADVPAWFELHPLEAAGALVYLIMEKLNSGYQPGEPCDGPNLWRIFSGDRMGWIGPSRTGLKGVDGGLGQIRFHVNGL